MLQNPAPAGFFLQSDLCLCAMLGCAALSKGKLGENSNDCGFG